MTEEIQYKPLDCAFESVQAVFALNIEQAVEHLSEASLSEYYEGAEFLAKIFKNYAMGGRAFW
jgi:nitric oxide reductase NorD protein